MPSLGESDDVDSNAETVEEARTKAQADAIFTDEVKTYGTRKARELEIRPSMNADLRGNLSAESVEKLSEEAKFLLYHEEDDAYGMLRLILKTHGGAKSGWKVTDSLDAQQQMFLLRQGKEESLLTYKKRFIAAAKTTSEFSPLILAIVFVKNMNSTNGVFQSDMAKLVALKKTDEYPTTIEEAYRQVSM